MSDFSTPVNAVPHELFAHRGQWKYFFLLGLALFLLGVFCIVDPLVPSLASVIFLGFALITAGIVQVISAFWAGKWSGMLLNLLLGVLYVAVGYMIIEAPVVNMVLITKFIAFFLFVSGVFRIISALVLRLPGWGWVLLNGVISLLLGIMINRQLPEAALWVIGMFIGIEMLFAGWTWMMLALGLRSLSKAS